MTDAGGTALAINSYDEYGIPKNCLDASPAPSGRFAYTGQIWLPGLGMYHSKALFAGGKYSCAIQSFAANRAS